MTFEKNTPAVVCVNCGKLAAIQVRRDELFVSGKDALIIENIPMLKCMNCGIVYLEPEISRTIDEICAHPELHASFEPKAVAKIA
jgi:YgiT-type zinc finger domain-containing protein